MNKRVEIIIEGIKIIIEKGEDIKTAPIDQHLIQYNPINIKRKYYKKGDPEYHRKATKGPICRPTLIADFLKSDKIVKQEPLLDLNY